LGTNHCLSSNLSHLFASGHSANLIWQAGIYVLNGVELPVARNPAFPKITATNLARKGGEEHRKAYSLSYLLQRALLRHWALPKSHTLTWWCAAESTYGRSCQTEGLGKEDAELLVYLVDEEMDIYIGIRRCLPPWFCRPNPFSYLGVVAVVYRTEKDRKKGRKTLPYIPMYGELRKRGLGLFLGRQLFPSRLTDLLYKLNRGVSQGFELHRVTRRVCDMVY
jgi:hypothetical protein